jgi:hypothetical protein
MNGLKGCRGPFVGVLLVMRFLGSPARADKAWKRNG